MKPIEVGESAPDFTATASDGRHVCLSDFRGQQAVVLFFYPRDNSLICTQEACSFRDAYEEFVQLGAVVIGISGDSDDSHRMFAASKNLPYYLISDSDGHLRELFGVPNSFVLIPGRVTYVIDLQGIVRLQFNSQLFGAKHVEEARQALMRLQH